MIYERQEITSGSLHHAIGAMSGLRSGCASTLGRPAAVRLRQLAVERRPDAGASSRPGRPRGRSRSARRGAGCRALATHRGGPVRHRAPQRRLSPHYPGDEQGRRRPAAGARRAAHRHLRPRPLLAGRRARPGQDAHDPDPGRFAQPQFQPHPVHSRPDAFGHHRHRGHPGRQGHRVAVTSATM